MDKMIDILYSTGRGSPIYLISCTNMQKKENKKKGRRNDRCNTSRTRDTKYVLYMRIEKRATCWSIIIIQFRYIIYLVIHFIFFSVLCFCFFTSFLLSVFFNLTKQSKRNTKTKQCFTIYRKRSFSSFKFFFVSFLYSFQPFIYPSISLS